MIPSLISELTNVWRKLNPTLCIQNLYRESKLFVRLNVPNDDIEIFSLGPSTSVGGATSTLACSLWSSQICWVMNQWRSLPTCTTYMVLGCFCFSLESEQVSKSISKWTHLPYQSSQFQSPYHIACSAELQIWTIQDLMACFFLRGFMLSVGPESQPVRVWLSFGRKTLKRNENEHHEGEKDRLESWPSGNGFYHHGYTT